MYNTILLVDDDPTQIAILSAYFSGQQLACTIRSATDPAVALEILKAEFENIDLIVSDLQMPNMDGIEFLRHLKNMAYENKLAILSGVGSGILEHAGRLAKMHNLQLIGKLAKPLNKTSMDTVFLAHKDTASEVADDFQEVVITQSDFSFALQSGEIKPYYQPKVDVVTGKIKGAESLARWERYDGNFVAPSCFVEFAEDNGRIEELTINLFSQVLRDAKTFLASDPSLSFAVNLSPQMLRNVSLPDRLYGMMNSAGLSSENISFEITENSILNQDAVTLEVLSRLRIQGFHVAIDDFGTGSSNIQTLRDFPFSELKIDRSFVSTAYDNEFSAQTVSVAVKFAQEMGMRTVAEGVEHIRDWELISEYGIDEAQGFLISKAVPPLTLIKFINDYDEDLFLKNINRANKSEDKLAS
ncbi:MAG: EAL domain-containing response regulator [Pseudomonadota bacterium]